MGIQDSGDSGHRENNTHLTSVHADQIKSSYSPRGGGGGNNPTKPHFDFLGSKWGLMGLKIQIILMIAVKFSPIKPQFSPIKRLSNLSNDKISFLDTEHAYESALKHSGFAEEL